MKRRTVVGIVSLVALQVTAIVAYLGLEAGNRPAGSTVQTFDLPRPPPPLTLKDRDGVTFGLERFRGRPLVLYFWASWCPECRARLPVFLGETSADDGHRRVAVSLDREWKDADAIAAGRSDVYLAAPGTADSWGIDSLPETFFVEPDGRVRARSR